MICWPLKIRRTKSRINGGLGAARFSDHDGCVGVVLLHSGVASCEEVPVFSRQPKDPSCMLPCLRHSAHRSKALWM
jgi:hypothetical protein